MIELKPTLERLGLKQTELARLLDVSPRTVSLWATGDGRLPGPVAAYLRVLLAAGPEAVAMELGRLNGRNKMFDEGLYALTYQGSDDAGGTGGDALAVLRAGRIIGSDRWGGMFEGSYHFDPNNQANQFQVRMQVPPHGELVTGFTGGPDGATVDFVAVLDRAAPVASAVIVIEGQPVDLRLTYLGPLPN